MSFLCFPSIYFRRYSAADEESLRQRISGFYSRWRVKGQLDGSLRSGFVRRSFVTGRSSLCLQQACRWRAGAGPAILCGKFRTGHEAAICSSRPSAASSQMQKHFSYWRLQRREEDGNQRHECPRYISFGRKASD